MPNFTIICADKDIHPVQISAADPSCALFMLPRLGCDKADILKDGAYDFSAKLNEQGVWCIFHKDNPDRLVCPPDMPNGQQAAGPG